MVSGQFDKTIIPLALRLVECEMISVEQLVFSFLQEIINHIRGTSHSAAYASFMSPPVVMQILSSMKIIMGEDGTDKGW